MPDSPTSSVNVVYHSSGKMARGKMKKQETFNNAPVCVATRKLLFFVANHHESGSFEQYFWEEYPRTNR